MRLPFLHKEEQPAAKPAEKQTTGKIALQGGSYSVLLTAGVLAVLVLINVLVSFLPKSLTHLDMSSAKLYSVTSSTKVVVNNLDEDVTVYWIVQSGQEDSVLENLLSRYEALSDHVTVVKKNPDVYPTFAEQYAGGDTVSNNSLVVECGDKYRYIAYDDIYLTDIDYANYTYVYSFDGEGAITSAIDYVVSDDLPVLYLLQGHGEADLPDDFADRLQKENISTETFSLLNTNGVPDDADAVLIYAPTSDISEEEEQLLEEYADNGGRLLVMAGPTEDGTLTNLYTLAKAYGVSTADGIVVESDTGYYAFQQPYILLPEIISDEITDSLIDENYYVIFPIAQGLEIEGDGKGTVSELLATSDTAFCKADGYNLTTYEEEEQDTDGPFSLAVRIETNGGGTIIWAGSSVFMDDTYNAYSSGANMDFTINSLLSLIGESDAVSIRTKSLDYNYLTISEGVSSTLKLVMVGMIPMIFVIMGILTVWERRQLRGEQA